MPNNNINHGKFLLGYVLSGANTRYASFQPREEAEDWIKEGMFVVIEENLQRKTAKRYYALIYDIESYHEFLEPGEVWSESLRKGIRPPDKVARKYVIAKTRILGEISDYGLRSASNPPRPGSHVYTVSGEMLSQIYGFDTNEFLSNPQYLKIGALYGYSEEEFPAVLNLENITMHIAIMGITGSGKSNTVGTIIEELGSREVSMGKYKTLPLIIIDANGDYVDYYENPNIVPNFAKVYRFVFQESKAFKDSIDLPNPKRKLVPIRIDLSLFERHELAELIIRFYHAGKLEGAELQLQLLQRVLDSYASRLEKLGAFPDFNKIFAKETYFSDFCSIMDELSKVTKDINVHTKAAVNRALNNFRRELVEHAQIIGKNKNESTLNEKLIDNITDPKSPALVIIDFSSEGATKVSIMAKQFVVYYLLYLLYKKFVEFKINGENRILILGIEEAQNFAPNTSIYPLGMNIARNMLATVATQGRKFGLSLLLITQRPSYVDPVVMSMMNTFIIHRVAPADLNYASNVSGGLPKYIKDRLTILEKGLAVLCGQMNPFPVPVLVKVRKRRSHKAGSVSVFTYSGMHGDNQ